MGTEIGTKFCKFFVVALISLRYLANSVEANSTDVVTFPPDRDDLTDICSRNDHFTDPLFTCCAKKRYEATTFYTTPSECSPPQDAKIVTSSWHIFKCMVDKALGGKAVSPSSLAEVLMNKELPGNVKSEINTKLTKMESEGHTPYNETEELKEFEAYANAWNGYYMAENWACNNAGKNNSLVDMLEGEAICYNWIDQQTRRGDCCKGIPIPFQLHPDPVVDRYFALRNWTAINLMTILGQDFDWQNTTIVMYSNNIDSCLRTATLIQQKKLSLQTLKDEIGNQTAPNIKNFADSLLPKFISPTIRSKMMDEVGNVTAINEDTDIIRMKNRNVSIYTYIYADEWTSRSFSENGTRFLFWNCLVHNLVIRRFKDVDMSEMC